MHNKNNHHFVIPLVPYNMISLNNPHNYSNQCLSSVTFGKLLLSRRALLLSKLTYLRRIHDKTIWGYSNISTSQLQIMYDKSGVNIHSWIQNTKRNWSIFLYIDSFLNWVNSYNQYLLYNHFWFGYKLSKYI